ncbi:MAG: hypothetical protein R3181_13740 [Rubricoccaceae bacterium]|nr:hypothetical protein [Rubricoccaceae bacterium]
MKRRLLPLALALLLAPLAAWSLTAPLGPADLLGTWQVDLRPTPDAEPYVQAFVVTSVEGDSLQGTFYGSPIERGRVNAAWGAVHFAFVTSDGSGPYHHAGRLDGDRLEGSTYAVGRGFLLPWRAERASD